MSDLADTLVNAKEDFGEGLVKVLQTPKRIETSLKKMYKLATLPADEAISYKHEIDASAFENIMGSLVGRIIAMPYRAMRDIAETTEEAYGGSSKLRGGPRGEAGDWTPEQYIAAAQNTMTAGAIVGGSMPGGGTGPANIGRKDALKMLAKEFRGMAKPKKGWIKAAEEGRTISHFNLVHVAKFGEKAEISLGQMREGYPTITKGLRDIPQGALDVVEEVGLAPKSKMDIHGRFLPGRSRVEYQIGGELPKETVPHEFLHAVQVSEMRKAGIKTISPTVLEAHAYEFEGAYLDAVGKLPKGQKPTMDLFNQVYEESFDTMLKKHGTDFSKYKMRDIVRGAHEGRASKAFSEKYPGATMEFKSEATDEVKKAFIELRPRMTKAFEALEEGIQEPLHELISGLTNDYELEAVRRNLDMRGFNPDRYLSKTPYSLKQNKTLSVEEMSGAIELKSAAPPKVGEMVDLPGGKAKFDGIWEASGSYPERYQYTFHSGIAKKDTFISESQKLSEVAKAGMRKIKMRGG